MRGPFFYSFATKSDVPEIHEFLLSDFLFAPSINAAIGLTRDDTYVRYREFIEENINGTSVVVRDDNGDVVGVRLSGYEDRHDEPARTGLDAYGPRLYQIRKIIAEINKGKWELIPEDIDRLFDIKLISVAERCRGRGIGKELLIFGLDIARKVGAGGAFAEAVATVSQGLFAKNGYSVIREIVHEEWLDDEGKQVFVCPDGTKTMQLVFRRI
ncbi:hypothetical protein PMAYCL1PPCAC_25792 [Pristionchus mayeri]|uniref:N-acetyltransferase domain-containing protein n=1 Tax=Pristionchus mayeri TaxID=1317129 RepID=A0AAN5D4K5_9BILA|nr:hypothetical protein PMAYCL1PPCAC_25792 [Pristionchus mayeri]